MTAPRCLTTPKGAHRPWAALTTRRGWRHGHHGNSAAPDGTGLPHTAHCARRAPGFGGGRLHCSHAPSHRRYVVAGLEGTILTAPWELASWSRPSRGRLLGAGPPAAFFMRVKAGPPPTLGLRGSRQGGGGPTSWFLGGRIGL